MQTNAQQSIPSPTVQNVQILPAKSESLDDARIKQLNDATEELKRQNAVLTKQLDTLTLLFFSVSGLISLILLVGTFTSFLSWKTDRARSSKLYDLSLKHDQESSEREKVIHGMQDQLYELFRRKENESHAREQLVHARQDALYGLAIERDRRVFGQSTETLNLVNETLQLAKDASERASKSLEEKLSRKHDELEREAIDLIDESKAYKSFKVLVEDSNYRSTLLTLAQEIAGLQNNQNILDKEVLLHPYCCFIRGMEFHLNQHFKPAIRFWKLAKEHPNVTNALKIMALYWIGYEQNNKGEFENAAANFELASNIATGAMRYELERIRIESKFFNTEKFESRDIIPEMETLYEEISEVDANEEFQKVKSGIAGTLGNMYDQLGDDLYETNRQGAIEAYEKAKEAFEKAPIRNKWNWFGYGEACFKLKQFPEAELSFMSQVKPEAEFEYSTRPEPRTKVLGQTTVLICSMRVKSLEENVIPLYNLIKTTLGTVEDGVTVYSQFRRRNVLKKAFLTNLIEVMTEFEQQTGVKITV
jgi:tetratricopeptide (TPR) repeat protein